MDLLTAIVVYAIAPAQTNNTQTIFFVNLILRSNMIMTSSYIHYLINQKKDKKEIHSVEILVVNHFSMGIVTCH